MEKDYKKFILDWLKVDPIICVNFWGDFYSSFHKFAGYNNFEPISDSQRKMRYHLNKLYKKGLLDKRIVGTGFMGKTDSGACNWGAWTRLGFWDLKRSRMMEKERLCERCGVVLSESEKVLCAECWRQHNDYIDAIKEQG